jgi:hypothetical protein
VRTGGRFDISPLDASAPDGSDVSLGLRDVLCRPVDGAPRDAKAQDVPLFDAAFLSARFPLVTPSGRIGNERSDHCVTDIPSGVDVVDGGYHENSGTAQVTELWNDLQPLLVVLNRNTDDDVPPIRPVLLQIENGENDEDDGIGCIEATGDDRSGTELAATAVQTTPTRPVESGDYAVRFGEPLRIPWAGVLTKVRGRTETGSGPLVESMCAAGVPVVTMALYGHPGRPLPLGWSLTGDLLRDLEHVFALEPNACRARAFVAFVDADVDVPLDEPSCPPSPASRQEDP